MDHMPKNAKWNLEKENVDNLVDMGFSNTIENTHLRETEPSAALCSFFMYV